MPRQKILLFFQFEYLRYLQQRSSPPAPRMSREQPGVSCLAQLFRNNIIVNDHWLFRVVVCADN